MECQYIVALRILEFLKSQGWRHTFSNINMKDIQSYKTEWDERKSGCMRKRKEVRRQSLWCPHLTWLCYKKIYRGEGNREASARKVGGGPRLDGILGTTWNVFEEERSGIGILVPHLHLQTTPPPEKYASLSKSNSIEK